jgi:hypothetical protein
MIFKKVKYVLFVLFVGFLHQIPAFSQEDDLSDLDVGADEATASVPSASKGKAGVLDFEGDIIEGERKRPDLFLQTQIDNLSLDAILYLRKDFNDFHQVDKNRRPGYYQRRGGSGR